MASYEINNVGREKVCVREATEVGGNLAHEIQAGEISGVE